ncbi:type II secretion system protein [Hydrogenophaga sp.]|uniref:type II secretion system protein n=1 Tax=Hydrogenophaga sp. TaxID=1904254 RepID=UPI00260ADB62|nr:prepilin-type N-terminal cleavage/methylation domain-containing protein [Hydrogenophaga sp.]MDM7948584.1 prepilin-type N-terminal cleavage/methylation domain-containing protein [Hydrogenophaga sp.]
MTQTEYRERIRTRPGTPRGFTLIELMVVMAIVATLLTLVTPRYFDHLDRAKEAALRETLAVTRDAIDQFHADHDRYPGTLAELVDKRYLRQLPLDPITDSRETWTLVPPPPRVEGGLPEGSVWDLRSGAEVEGKRYDQW